MPIALFCLSVVDSPGGLVPSPCFHPQSRPSDLAKIADLWARVERLEAEREAAWRRLGAAPDPLNPGFFVCNALAYDQWEALRQALFNEPAVPNKDPDLSCCPRCGGLADNGHDRCFPPTVYFCTKCAADLARGAEAFPAKNRRPGPASGIGEFGPVDQ